MKKYKKYIKFYIPKIAFDNLHHKIQIIPPEFKYEIETFYSILSDLSKEEYNNEEHNLKPMYSKWLQMKYGNQYNEYLKYMVQNGIIYGSNYYNQNQCYYYGLVINNRLQEILNNSFYSTSYCLQLYRENNIQIIDNQHNKQDIKKVRNFSFVVVKISKDSKVGRYITNEHKRELDRLKHYPHHLKIMNKHFKENLKIEYNAAMEYVMQFWEVETEKAGANNEKLIKVENRVLHRIRSIEELKEGKGKLRFKRNKRNRRLDTNLTNMGKDLRPFLIGYENLSYLDLCNSQPVLFNIILKGINIKNNPKLKREMEDYEKITLSGKWYEALMDIYKIQHRELAKLMWMLVAYSSNDKKHSKNKSKFSKRFPEINKIIKKMKEPRYEQFSIELQRIESKIFIDEICKELVEKGIIPYTLHDGVIVPKERKEETYQVMAEILKKHLGSVPVIEIDGVKTSFKP
jgi:hypothetical protein